MLECRWEAALDGQGREGGRDWRVGRDRWVGRVDG